VTANIVVFLLWGCVRAVTFMMAAPPPPHAATPYTNADRARDCARGEGIRRQSMEIPALRGDMEEHPRHATSGCGLNVAAVRSGTH